MLPPSPVARLLGGWGCQRAGRGHWRAIHVLAAQQHAGGQGAAAAAAQLPPALSLLAATPTATQLLATYFACELHPSDCYLLYGSVGAGKSYFSRAFIRAAAEDAELPVPSPTFLLQNIYTDHDGPPIHHFDLYRLTQRYDMARLDLPASFSQAVCLVEWPERLALAPAAAQPAQPLELHFSILEGEEQRALQAALERRHPRRRRRQEDGVGEEGSGSEEEGLASSSSGDDDDDEGSGDARWRRVQLRGGQRWQPRLQLLRRYLQTEGAQVGCYLEEEAEEEQRPQPTAPA